MTVLITLTTAGSDSGPFNLYSNVDGYTTPFETGVLKSLLVAGYTSVLVPTGTTIIQVRSLGTCTNSINLSVVLLGTSTTTTTLPTTTTTTTTTTLPTTTSSSTTTTTAPPTSTTTSSTTTSTSSTTTTTTTTTEPPLWLCENYSVTISSGSGDVGWTNCNGSFGFGTVTPEEPLVFCAQVGTVSSSATVNITPGSPCAEECIEYTVSAENGGGTVDYTDCFGNPQSFTVAFGEVSAPFCALQGSVFTSGFLLIGIIGDCGA